jgi:DnaK suppressor protein
VARRRELRGPDGRDPVAGEPTGRRAELESRKRELEERIVRVHHDLVHADVPLEQDFAEQAVQRENDEVLAGIESSAKAELARIRRALVRIDQGTYGVCEACGESIDPARLSVVPDAARCISCAERH